MLENLTVEEIASVVSGCRARGPLLVGIDGPGASGKSLLADALGNLLGATVVHGDDFYKPSKYQPSSVAEHGQAFDLDRLLAQVVAPGALRQACRYQIYDWDSDSMGRWVEIPSDTSIIVEGVYTTEQRLRNFYDFRIFCTADSEVRLSRGLQRDGEKARAQWVDNWMPAEDRYSAMQRPDEAAQMVLCGESAGPTATFRWDS